MINWDLCLSKLKTTLSAWMIIIEVCNCLMAVKLYVFEILRFVQIMWINDFLGFKHTDGYIHTHWWWSASNDFNEQIFIFLNEHIDINPN